MLTELSLREQINQAITEKIGENPKDRFKILHTPRQKEGIYEIMVQWNLYDQEVLSIDLKTLKKQNVN